MSRSCVYGSFEVREGFGPNEVGPLELETESRFDAETRLEEMWTEGRCVQLFGIKSHDETQSGERVLLRSLVAPIAA